MPSPESHINQYKKNRKTLEKIMSMENPPYDWVVTIAFYTAIHLIEKFIVEKNPKKESSTNHDERMRWVTNISELKPIRNYYYSLSQNSWQSRYRCIPFNESQAKMTVEHLEKIESQLNKYL